MGVKAVLIKLSVLIILIGTIFLVTDNALASEYILPYPSYMPGHKLYGIHQIWEKSQEYWYFGNLAKFKYYLAMTDKYLVEAKTLFEYKQYWLATKALEKSNNHFNKLKHYLDNAKREGKEMNANYEILKQAALKHKEVFENLLDNLPDKIVWEEENKNPLNIELKKILQQSIIERDRYVNF